jgi:EREBP-like factor
VEEVALAAELVFDDLAPLWVEDVVELGPCPSQHSSWTPCDGLDAAAACLHSLPLLWDY